MGRYLHNIDYSYSMQNSTFNQLLGNAGTGGRPVTTLPASDFKVEYAESMAKDMIKSYTIQRWDIDEEFKDLNVWSYTASYSGGDRVILDYSTFTSSVDYATGSCTIYDSVAYLSLGNSATTSTPYENANWVNIGNQYDIYYANNPYVVYNENNDYVIGDVVYWKGHTYSATSKSFVMPSDLASTYVRLENIPPKNVKPDSIYNDSSQYWSDSGTYSISSETYVTDTTYWTKGDNRNRQIVMLMVDIALFYLHQRIQPDNMPKHRQASYDMAIKTLKMASNGVITLNMPEKQPIQGLKIRYSGNIRKNNNI